MILRFLLQIAVVAATLGLSLPNAAGAQEFEAPSSTIAVQSSFSVWCRDQLSGLREARIVAQRYYTLGKYGEALSVLRQALNQASLKTQQKHTGAMTVAAVKRGVTLVTQIGRVTANSPRYARSLIYFMDEYFQFIEDVATRFDQVYYRPLPCGYCQQKGMLDFEREYLDYSSRQLSMVLEKLTTPGPAGEIYPLGEAVGYLKALELMAYWTAKDFEFGLFANRYACEVERLYALHAKLKNYKTTYLDEFDAVNASYWEAKSVLGEVGGCGGAPVRSNSGSWTIEVSSGVHLSSGSNQSVYLGDSFYVTKLIISAEGVRTDAMFDVMVNGDTKGTVYVPGRDPSYIVTVEARTQSIELISRSGGSVRIHSIKAVVR